MDRDCESATKGLSAALLPFKEEKIAAYRFVHAADIHLDSPLRSLALRDPGLAELIGNATRRAFVRIIDLCLDEQVNALLLAGDLYDGDQTSMKTARFLAEQLRRLHEANIRVFIIRGNHDALSRITKELTYPDSVKLFGGRADIVAVERQAGEFPVAVHGLSFAQPHAPESLVGKLKPPVEGAVNIAMLHTSLAGAPGHDHYAPCSVADLLGAGFQYWALGHIHRRSVVEGPCAIVMPGMPQGRDINEAGVKSVSLVTIGDDRSIRIEERATAIAQFERLTVDAAGIDDWRELVSAITRTLERARAGSAAQHLVTRLHIIGAATLSWRIRNDLDLLKTEAEEQAKVIGACWIEAMIADCRAPAQTEGAAADPLAELGALIGDVVFQSDAYRAEAAEIVEGLRAQLPQECRAALGSDAASFQAALAAIARDGAEDVLARLHGRPDGGRS